MRLKWCDWTRQKLKCAVWTCIHIEINVANFTSDMQNKSWTKAIHYKRYMHQCCRIQDAHASILLQEMGSRTQLGKADVRPGWFCWAYFRGGNTLFFAPVAGGNTTTYDNILILVVSAITRRFSDVLHCHTSRYRVVTFWLDRDTDDVTSGQSFHEFLAWAEEEDPLVEMPRDLHLVLGLHD